MNKKTNEFIKRAHEMACRHGFHDKELSLEHCLMLVITEISEMVEAHRKGYYHFKETFHPKMATVEEWRATTCSDEYEVSNFGRVRSKDMQVWNGNCHYTKKGRILRAGLTKGGYLTVCLRSVGTKKVSILVANAFLKKQNPNVVVNHIDGNKLNNNVGNLEFVSPSDNNSHALKTGLRSSSCKLPYEDKLYIAFEHKKGRAYTSILKDKDFGVTRSAIQRICHDYKKYTDSVEMEMADACIRLYDTAGTFGVTFDKEDFDVDMHEEYEKYYSHLSLTEKTFALCGVLLKTLGNEESLKDIIGSSLYLLELMAEEMHIDLFWFIERKMEYNETRNRLHGKKY